MARLSHALSVGRNANTTRCAITLCDIDPLACESEVSPTEALSLILLMVLPCVVAWLFPLIAAPCVPLAERRDHDDPTVVERGLRATIRSYRERIDPPMYLCGVGLLPWDCGASGLLGVILAMGVGVFVVFFGLLFGKGDLENHPCDGGLGSCRTISCICGNMIAEGYVFMFTCLFVTSILLVQRFSTMGHRHRRQHVLVKAVLVFGSLLLLLTAIFPERYDADGTLLSYGLEGLHLVGVFGAGSLLMGIPYIWFAMHWSTHRQEIRKRSLVVRTLYILLTTSLIVAMRVRKHGDGGAGLRHAPSTAKVCSSQVANETNNLCAYMPTEAECVSFPLLSPSECAPLRRCADACSGAAPCECEDGTLPNYTCRWLNATADTVTATLAPESYQRVNRIGPRCVKAECPLYRYARGVALEFGVLFLILCYVSTFALHDVSRLLARPPSAERMSLSVIQTTHSRPALIPLRDSMSASGAASTMVAPLDARLITGHHVSEEAVVGSAETVVRIAYPSAPLAR